MTREDMEAEQNELMIKACFQPKVSYLATKIFSTIRHYTPECSVIVGGMGFSFQGLDKLKLIKNAKKLQNINLERYEPYIDKYVNGLREIYEAKDTKDG